MRSSFAFVFAVVEIIAAQIPTLATENQSTNPVLISSGAKAATIAPSDYATLATPSVSIDVGSDGKPSTCRMLASTGNPQVDSKVCAAMLTSRFTPARDSTGAPIAGGWTGFINLMPFTRKQSGARSHNQDGSAAQSTLRQGQVTNDYPTAALREGRQGTTAFRLLVGTDGKGFSCEVTGTSGSPDLDEATCRKVMARATFHPATDPSGNPVESVYENRLRWVIPAK